MSIGMANTVFFRRRYTNRFSLSRGCALRPRRRSISFQRFARLNCFAAKHGVPVIFPQWTLIPRTTLSFVTGRRIASRARRGSINQPAAIAARKAGRDSVFAVRTGYTPSKYCKLCSKSVVTRLLFELRIYIANLDEPWRRAATWFMESPRRFASSSRRLACSKRALAWKLVTDAIRGLDDAAAADMMREFTAQGDVLTTVDAVTA